jgi:hypothetical protein
MPAPKGNQNAKGNRGGPGGQTKFKPEFVAQAVKACQAGFTDRELADLFGVAETTINAWKHEHIEFAEALKIGKAVADDRVERSLYHRAVGYSHDAVKIFMPAGAPKPVYAPFTEHFPPDTTAAIFWLKNRKPADWRDKQEIEHTGGVTLNVTPDDAAL